MNRRMIIASSVALLLLPDLSAARQSGVPPSSGSAMQALPPASCQASAQFTWNGRNFNRFRGPPFHYPRGFRYRRWRTGDRLPHELMSPRFRFNSWSRMGIGRPPAGRRWVRYGPDLLLVNNHTRRIEDVIFMAFF
jgi:Ni/Co efflux regulator RcnB